MLVQAVIEIPDDEVIESRVPAKISYMTGLTASEPMKVKEVEGYLEPYRLVNIDEVAIAKLKTSEDDVIVFRYPADTYPEDAALMKDILKTEFPDNKVLGVTSDVELLVSSPDEAIDMLERMIAHIKVASPVQKKIILS